MVNNLDPTKGKWPIKRIVLICILVVTAIVGILVYSNFNRLLSDALMKSFNSSLASDVYELKFEKLRVNLVEGSIRVMGVVIKPREEPLKEYLDINSSFVLTTERLTLMNVELWMLLKSSVLRLERISIHQPYIQLDISDLRPVFIPFKDTTTVTDDSEHSNKKAIESFVLDKFELLDASFHVTNHAKEREFRVSAFNVALNGLSINQQPGEDRVAFQRIELSLGEFMGHLRKGAVRKIGFHEFKIGIDSLAFQATVDTVIYRVDDFTMGFNNLDMLTADSLFHLTMQSFDLSYKRKSVTMAEVVFTPNISEADMQARFVYQHTNVSGSVESLSLRQVNFDSLINHRTILIDSVLLDKPDVSIFKDNTKPVDKNRIPAYFGQQLGALPVSLRVKHVKATNIHLVNVERKRDSSYARVSIHRGTALVGNITKRSRKPMTLHADAYIENKVHFDLQLGFSYQEPEFTLNGKLGKFNLMDLNSVILAYTPAKINRGTADEISFSGMVYKTNSTGTMKFLYHDLEVDLELQKKARWKSAAIAFAANAIVDSSNPPSAKLPPRIVKFEAKRDMNKGFINLIIKSLLSGVKETLIMSKENRQSYKDSKKKAKKSK